MAEEDDRPLRPDSPLALLVKEDLEVMGFDELDERIDLLEAEVQRIRAMIKGKSSSRHAAESVFD